MSQEGAAVHNCHACKVVRVGRSFLRRLIDLAATVKYLDRRVRLNQAARADLMWWWQFGTRWNGVELMVAADAWVPSHMMVSDASCGWGCGCGAEWDGRWFQIQWQGLGKKQSFSIMAKELLPIVVVVAIWDPSELGGKSGKGQMRQHVDGGHGQLRFM